VIREVALGDKELCASIQLLPDSSPRAALLHACFQLIHLVARDSGPMSVERVDRLCLTSELPSKVWAHAVVRGDRVDVSLVAEDDRVVLELLGSKLRARAAAQDAEARIHQQLVGEGRSPEEAQIGAQLSVVLARVLGRDASSLDLDGDWKAYGLDSLMELEIVRRMERKLGLALRLTALPVAAPAALGVSRSVRTEAARIAAMLSRRSEGEGALQPVQLGQVSWDARPPAEYLETFSGAPRLRSALVKGSSELELDVVVLGAGSPVVLLPPIISSALIWKYQVEALAARHQVLIPNYPGWGRSRFQHREIAVERLSEQLLALLDALGVRDPVDLIGWSLGGMVAQVTALAAPTRVRSLVLVNTTAKLDEEDTIENAQRMLGSLKRDIDLGLEALPHARREETRALISRASGSADRSLDMYYLGAVLRFDARERLAAIRTPTLVVQGKRDPIANPRVGQLLRDRIPNARYLESEAGHYIPLHDSERLNHWLLDFLKGRNNP
jgi:pimeloyl-ACP methyl ester carboxylesterase